MTAFPDTLKSWRKTRRLSQLDLAGEANVSSRHISFLETGRARPSAEMIGRLGDALDLPLSARNQMLTHAGFAPRYAARDWDAADMAPIREAVRHMLDSHAPFPALAVDRLWRILRMNRPAAALFAALNVVEGDSLLDLMLSDHLPPLVENWPHVAHHAASRLRTESAAQGGVADLDRAAQHLSAQASPNLPGNAPVIPMILTLGGVRLSLFSTIAQFGTPDDLTLDDLKIELYFPADAASATALRSMEAMT